MFQIQVQDNGKHSSVKSRPNLDLNTLVQMKATMVFPFLLIGEIMCFWFHSWGLHNASKPILYFISSGKSNEIFSILFLKFVKSYHYYIRYSLVKYICKLISTTKNTLKLFTAQQNIQGYCKFKTSFSTIIDVVCWLMAKIFSL